jgi:hypothetical protein
MTLKFLYCTVEAAECDHYCYCYHSAYSISSMWQCSFSCITANNAKMIFGWCYQMTWAKSDHIKRCLLLYKETRRQHQWIQMNSISSTFFKRRRKSTSTEESRLISFQRCSALRIPRGGGGSLGVLWGLEKNILRGVLGVASKSRRVSYFCFLLHFYDQVFKL